MASKYCIRQHNSRWQNRQWELIRPSPVSWIDQKRKIASEPPPTVLQGHFFGSLVKGAYSEMGCEGCVLFPS